MNIPPGTQEVSLWAALHVDGIRAGDRFRDGESARILLYSAWPGESSVPAGVSREEESRLIAGYQSKWREESLSWSELESAITTECQQVIDISDATLAASPDNSSIALRISGLLNYTAYRELFLRAERLTLTRGDGHDLGISGLRKMGEAYWDVFERRKPADSQRTPSET
jgi:hypothetical protein